MEAPKHNSILFLFSIIAAMFRSKGLHRVLHMSFVGPSNWLDVLTRKHYRTF